MKLSIQPTQKLEGTVRVPPSKSHTHRAVILASLGKGVSTIENSLLSSKDCLATIRACRKIGARITQKDQLEIRGAEKKLKAPGRVNAANSGTTLRFMSAISALSPNETTLTGDDSVKQRPIQPLLDTLNALGAQTTSTEGHAPVTIRGPLHGGKAVLEGGSSQFLSALLISCPLAEENTTLTVRDLVSKPYAEMTLAHLERVGIQINRKNLSEFFIDGGQMPTASDYTVPGDYSSASFLLAARKITNSDFAVSGLDPKDSQPDQRIMELVKELPSTIDLVDTPDLLPIAAVLACFSNHEVTIQNVAHARTKESDRIHAIAIELEKMGATIREKEDGLVIQPSELHGAVLQGHNDHRIVMALAVAALGAKGKSLITDAESISVSYPSFVSDLQSLGAQIEVKS